jgi:hypothetical protein
MHQHFSLPFLYFSTFVKIRQLVEEGWAMTWSNKMILGATIAWTSGGVSPVGHMHHRRLKFDGYGASYIHTIQIEHSAATSIYNIRNTEIMRLQR